VWEREGSYERRGDGGEGMTGESDGESDEESDGESDEESDGESDGESDDREEMTAAIATPRR